MSKSLGDFGFFLLGTFFEFGIKRRGIPAENEPHGFLAEFFVLLHIVTLQTATIGTTVDLYAKALTVKLKAARLFAGTTHVLNFITMGNLNL